MITRINVTNATVEEIEKLFNEGWDIEINGGNAVAVKDTASKENTAA